MQPPAITPRPAPEPPPSASAPTSEVSLSTALPQERPLANSGAPARKAWLGWGVACAVLASGIGFYAFVYRPMSAELASTKQASATQAQQQSAVLDSVQAELQRTRSELQQVADAALAARAAPQQPAPVTVETPKVEKRGEQPPAADSQPKAKEPAPVEQTAAPTQRPARVAKRSSSKPEPAAEPKTKGVDREAAAAATAELEAAAYSGKTAAPSPSAPAPAPAPEGKQDDKPAAAAPPEKAPEKAAAPAPAAPAPGTQELRGVDDSSSDDPLEGL